MAGTVKGKRYIQEQKVYALKQVEAGSQRVEVCRRLRVSVATFLSMETDAGIDGHQ
jgi:hypothetical protein